jgi:hypothetical protein
MKKTKIKLLRRTPAVVLTQKQVDYKDKPEMRNRLKESARKNYRSGKGREFELGGTTILRSLDFYTTEAINTNVMNPETGVVRPMAVIRPTKLALLLNTTYQTVWRWITVTGQLPEPALFEVSPDGGQGRGVYHISEVEVMIRALADHLKGFKYYRSDHTATTEKIFSQIAHLRTINYGEQYDGNQASNREKARTFRKRSGK